MLAGQADPRGAGLLGQAAAALAFDRREVQSVDHRRQRVPAAIGPGEQTRRRRRVALHFELMQRAGKQDVQQGEKVNLEVRDGQRGRQAVNMKD